MIWWGLLTEVFYNTTIWDIYQGEGYVKELIYQSLLAVPLSMLIFKLNFSRVQLKYLSVERAVKKLERESDLHTARFS